MQDVRLKLNQPIEQLPAVHGLFDGRWKYIHASGFRPMLYDLVEDPIRTNDLDRGEDPVCCRDVIARLQSEPCSTGRCIPRATSRRSMEKIAAYAENQLQVKGGILIGIWDETELAAIKDGIAQRAKL